jgi:hypothetical protein
MIILDIGRVVKEVVLKDRADGCYFLLGEVGESCCVPSFQSQIVSGFLNII